MTSSWGVLRRTIITGWCYFIFASGCILWGILVIPLTLAIGCFWPGVRAHFTDFTAATLRAYIQRLPFLQLKVDRNEKTCDEPRVFVVNHQSWLDPIAMLSLERRLSGPARGYLFRVPALRSVLRLGHFFESDIGVPASFDRMHLGVRAALENRGSLLFFPEGTRSKTGEIGAFHLGAFRMAVEYGLPIQPVVIDGLDGVLPPGSVIIRARGRHLVQVRYLELVRPPYGEGSQRHVVRQLGKRIRLSMVAELSRLRKERESI